MPNLSNNGLAGLFIDGKQVKKASLGGTVFFEKHNYNLSVTSNKQTLSYYDHDTCIITASLTDWGEPLEGESVVFSCDNPIETIEVSSSGIYDFGEYFIINCAELPINLVNLTQRIVIGDTDNFLEISKKQEDKVVILKNNSGWSGFNDDIVIKNGVLKAYQEEYQEYQTLDVSDVDLTKWTLITTNSVVIPVEKYFYETAVTDSNGEASVYYDSKGAGDLNIKACVPERMLVTEIYVEDCIFYDDASTDKSSSYIRYSAVSNTNTVGTISYNNGYYSSSGGNNTSLFLLDGLVKMENCKIELECKPTDTNWVGAIGLGFQIQPYKSHGLVTYTDNKALQCKYPWSSYKYYYDCGFVYDSDGYHNFKVEKTGNTIKMENGTTYSISDTAHYIAIMKGTGTAYWKKLKIKAL